MFIASFLSRFRNRRLKYVSFPNSKKNGIFSHDISEKSRIIHRTLIMFQKTCILSQLMSKVFGFFFLEGSDSVLVLEAYPLKLKVKLLYRQQYEIIQIVRTWRSQDFYYSESIFKIWITAHTFIYLILVSTCSKW